MAPTVGLLLLSVSYDDGGQHYCQEKRANPHHASGPFGKLQAYGKADAFPKNEVKWAGISDDETDEKQLPTRGQLATEGWDDQRSAGGGNLQSCLAENEMGGELVGQNFNGENQAETEQEPFARLNLWP